MKNGIVDLSGCSGVLSGYGGGVGKFAVDYNLHTYMVKKSKAHLNDALSEHLGCSIFALMGIPVQETFLAYYRGSEGSQELVVACRDFREDLGERLCTGSTVSKQFISPKEARCPELKDLEKIFTQCQPGAKEDIQQRFWETFVVDALIGNRSRHLDDWGFLSRDLEHLKLAPVYDCGRSLGADADEALMLECLADPQAMYNAECRIVTNFKVNGQAVTYGDMLLDPPPALATAIKALVPKICLDEIFSLVDSVPVLPETRNRFIKSSIAMRYEQLLLPALRKIEEKRK